MKWIKNTWLWLKGKKTNIGTALMLIAQGIQLFAPNLMPLEQLNYLSTVGAVIAGVGLTDKGLNTSTAKKVMNTLIKQKEK